MCGFPGSSKPGGKVSGQDTEMLTSNIRVNVDNMLSFPFVKRPGQDKSVNEGGGKKWRCGKSIG